MPFAGYKNFKECERKNVDKDDPGAYCATIMRKVEGDKNEIDVLTIMMDEVGGVPRETENYYRDRQISPEHCKPGSYAQGPLKNQPGKQGVFCTDKRTGKRVVQSVLTPKSKKKEMRMLEFDKFDYIDTQEFGNQMHYIASKFGRRVEKGSYSEYGGWIIPLDGGWEISISRGVDNPSVVLWNEELGEIETEEYFDNIEQAKEIITSLLRNNKYSSLESKTMEMKEYRCLDCGENWFSVVPPKTCPYCGSDAILDVERQVPVALRLMEGERNMNKNELNIAQNEISRVQNQYTDFNDLLWHGELDWHGIRVMKKYAETHSKDEIKELCNYLSRYGYENNVSFFNDGEVKAAIMDNLGDPFAADKYDED